MTPYEFSELPTSEQAIRIAQDVIQQLTTKKYVSTPGDYIVIDRKDIPGEDDEELCNVLDKIPQCFVCALGGMMLSHVRFRDNFKIEQLNFGSHEEPRFWGDDIRKHISDVFSLHDLAKIECAYEKDDVSDELYNYWEYDYAYETEVPDESDTYDKYLAEKETCINFGSRYSDPTDRMIAIMNNVIQHKGHFIPEL